MSIEGNFLSFAQRIRIRLFLEGVEIPVIAASIAGAPNSPATCSIQIPPLVEGTRLLPRTLVHLFFQDSYETANPYVLDSSTSGNTASPDGPDARDIDAQIVERYPELLTLSATACGDNRPKWSNRRYKLCFGGEVIGFQWTKTPLTRSLVLQCEDWSNYWDYAYQWSNTSIFGPGMKAVFSGGSTNLFTDFLSEKGSVLVSTVLRGKCNSFPKLQGLAAGLINLIESIGGSYYTPAKDAKGNAIRKFGGQNIFFSVAELRLHITQMVMSYENDPTSKRLLSRGGYDGLFGRAIGGLGEQVSMRQAITVISKIMFHETYPQPCPYYKQGTGTDASGTRRVKLKDDPNLSPFAEQARGYLETLTGVQTQLTKYKEDPLLATRSFQQAVRKSMTDVKLQLTSVRKGLMSGVVQMRQVSAPPLLVSIYQMAAQALQLCISTAEQWRPANTASPINKNFEEKLKEAKDQLKRVLNLTINTVNLAERDPPRLVQQILRPDIWFGAPPRCNVIFPDMYDQLTYQTMFLQEPTRFLLKTNDEFFGEDFLFDKFYFAPQAGSVKKEQANMRDMLRNDVLDHELFTGILPVFEKMGEFNIFAARDNRGTQGQPMKVSFAQRSANFLYFKHRFNARQFQVSARFTPYVAVGFPGLILDRWVDQYTTDVIRSIRDQYLEADPENRNLLLPKYAAELMGTNFLANFVEVTHSISQEQLRGVTDIRCQYARQVEESIEFLGVTERVQTVQKRQEGDAIRGTMVAAVDAPKVGSLGPNRGVIKSVTNVTELYLRGAQSSDADPLALSAGRRLPVYYGGARRAGGTNLQDIQVPVGVPVSLDNVGPVYWTRLLEFLGTDTTSVTFRAWSIEEEVPRYRLEDVDIPAEEVIRPGWYGDIWSPSQISDVYKAFFGIGAITETTAILDAKPGSGSANAAFKKAVAEAQTAEDMEDACASAPVVTSLQEKASIQQAVEFLTLTYSYVKLAGADADEFIRAYTWRPIASMLDIFGSEDLAYSEDGVEVISPGAVEGFHSRAFGPYDNVFGIVTPEIESIVGLKRGTAAAQRVDTRKRKLERVLKLVSTLNAGTARVG